MFHAEQMCWPTDMRRVTRGNMSDTELWVFKERLYNGLCTIIEGPMPAKFASGIHYAVLEDNASICYGVYTNGNPAPEWSYLREVRTRSCGPET